MAPNDTTPGPQRRHRYENELAPGPSISGPQRREYSILECVATSGDTDLLFQLVAQDADHLYEAGQRVLRSPGIRRTSTTIVLRELLPYRTHQLLEDE